MNKTDRRKTQSAHNLKYELFAHEYMVDLDPGAAYLRVGYKAATEEIAQSAGRRLLRNTYVQLIIERIKLQRIEEAGNDGKKTIERLGLVYLEAVRTGDLSTALGCLRELGKHYGIYEKHNKQRYTQEDAERLKKELEQAGFNFERFALANPN